MMINYNIFLNNKNIKNPKNINKIILKYLYKSIHCKHIIIELIKLMSNTYLFYKEDIEKYKTDSYIESIIFIFT